LEPEETIFVGENIPTAALTSGEIDEGKYLVTCYWVRKEVSSRAGWEILGEYRGTGTREGGKSM